MMRVPLYIPMRYIHHDACATIYTIMHVYVLAGKRSYSIARITGWIPADDCQHPNCPDCQHFIDADDKPAPLWHIQFTDGDLAGTAEDMEAYQFEQESIPTSSKPPLPSPTTVRAEHEASALLVCVCVCDVEVCLRYLSVRDLELSLFRLERGRMRVSDCRKSLRKSRLRKSRLRRKSLRRSLRRRRRSQNLMKTLKPMPSSNTSLGAKRNKPNR